MSRYPQVRGSRVTAVCVLPGQSGNAAVTAVTGCCLPHRLLPRTWAARVPVPRSTVPRVLNKPVRRVSCTPARFGLRGSLALMLTPLASSPVNQRIRQRQVVALAADDLQHPVLVRFQCCDLRPLFGDHLCRSGENGNFLAHHQRPPWLLPVFPKSFREPVAVTESAYLADVQAGAVGRPQSIHIVTWPRREELAVHRHGQSSPFSARPRSIRTAAAVDSVQRWRSAKRASCSITSGVRLAVSRSVRSAFMCSSLQRGRHR